jgi:hypothetical protein
VPLALTSPLVSAVEFHMAPGPSVAAGETRAATVIHHGSMDNVLSTGQALARWIDRNGYRSSGYLRELTLEHSHDRDLWVTELQAPIEPASAAGGR